MILTGETVVAIIGAVLGSSALFAFIQFLITRKDKKHDKFKEVLESISSLSKDVQEIKEDVATMRTNFKSDIDMVSDKIDRSNAIQSRLRILRANDEMRQDVHHSYEYFRQLHQDITDYETYCRAHPEFKNNEAVNSIEYINRVYQDCLDKNNFLV